MCYHLLAIKEVINGGKHFMSVTAIVLSSLDIIFAVALIILFLAQEGNDNGMGVVGGASTDSFYNKQKGRTLEEKLKSFCSPLPLRCSRLVIYRSEIHGVRLEAVVPRSRASFFIFFEKKKYNERKGHRIKIWVIKNISAEQRQP